MQAVKAYYDGRAFVPIGGAKFLPKQQAMVVVEEASAERSDDDAASFFVQKYKGSIKRKIDEKAELESYRNEKCGR